MRPLHPAIAENLPLLFLVIAYCALGYAVEALAGLPGRMNSVWFQTTVLVYPTLMLAGLPFAFAAHRWDVRDSKGRWIPGRAGWRAALDGAGTEFVTPRRVTGVAIATLVMPLLLNTYAGWQSLLPALNPYAYDPQLSEADRLLHLGRLPWEHLHPLLGRPAVTRTIDLFYHLWLPLNAAVLVWQGWSGRPGLRTRFFLSYALLYVVLGTGVAIALSSAGPSYFAEVTGRPSPYSALMEYLGALDAQQPLLAVREQRTPGVPFEEISAMPSMHVAVAVLFAVLGWRTRALLGVLFTAYAVVVLVGSVHLAWDYALDGYAGIVGALAVWALVGAGLGRWRAPVR